MRLAGLLREPAIPGEAVAGTKSYEEVIDAEGGGDADGEEGQEEVEDKEGGGVNVAVLVGEAQGEVEALSDYQAQY